MSKFPVLGSLLVCGLAMALARSADARPVVYTLNTVSDGKLGDRSFSEAPVVIEFHGDTNNVVNESSAAATVFANRKGYATVTVTINQKKYTAHFKSGEIFVRYDTTNGLVGFGSTISPTYPITLGCGNSDCTLGDGATSNGIAQALALLAADPATYSSLLSTRLKSLPASLSRTTLLTGSTHACPVPYTTDSSGNPFACAPPLPIPVLHTTDQGDFYLQDGVTYPSYYNGNVAVLTVVTGSDDD